MGRPTLLDDLVSKRIVDAAGAGVSRRAACEAANVSQRTLFGWLERGRDGEEPYAQFLQRLEAAESKRERKVVEKLMEHIEAGNVPLLMFWLKSRRGWRENDVVTNDAAPAAGAVEGVDQVDLLESLLAAAKSRTA